MICKRKGLSSNHMDDKIIDCIVGWMVLLWILFGVCMIGLILALIKGVLILFGVESSCPFLL